MFSPLSFITFECFFAFLLTSIPYIYLFIVRAMKNHFSFLFPVLPLLLLFLSVSMLFSGCIIDLKTVSGSSDMESKSYSYTGFSRIQLSQTFQVDVYPSDDFRVEVEFNRNLSDLLVVEMRDNTLVLGLQQGYQYKNLKLRARVYAPQITDVMASGATVVRLQNIRVPRFSLSLSGASGVEGALRVEEQLKIDASGASSIILEGSAESAIMAFSGASKFLGKQFNVRRLFEVKGSGAGQITVCTEGEIRAGLSGACALYYYGNAEVASQQLSGASVLKRLGDMPE